MCDINSILLEARKFSESVELDSLKSSKHEVVLIFPTIPTYEQQLAIQRIVTPGATSTPNIRVFGFPGESYKKMFVHLVH